MILSDNGKRMTPQEFVEKLRRVGTVSTNTETNIITITLGGDVKMMEKYGVDLNELPATDDQLKELKKIAKMLKVEAIEEPKNRVHADELILEFGKKAVYMPVDPDPKEV